MAIEDGKKLSDLELTGEQALLIYGIREESFKFTPKQVVDAGRPNATTDEAVAGVNAELGMTPATTKAAIRAEVDAEVGPALEAANEAAAQAQQAASDAAAAVAQIQPPHDLPPAITVDDGYLIAVDDGTDQKGATPSQIVDASGMGAIPTPAAIATRRFPPSLPAINTLGYPTSPGARTEWIRAAGIPAAGPYQADASGQVWVPSPFEVKAEHFGAMRSGQRGDQAINTAIDFAAAQGRGQVIIPHGEYIIQSALTENLSPDRDISIVGAGLDSTVLTLDTASASSAIDLTAPNTRACFTMLRDFSVCIDGQSPTGTAISATMLPGGVQDRISLVMQNLRVFGKNIATDYIGRFYNITGHWRPRLIDLFGTGCWGPDIAAPGGNVYADASPLFFANVGLNFDGCYSPYLVRCRMSSCKIGFQSIGDKEEGYYIQDTIANQVRIGYMIQRTDPEPLAFLNNVYASFRDKGLHINGGKHLRIRDPYMDQLAPTGGAVPVDILLENVTDVKISGGVHNYVGDSRRVAYQVFAGLRAQRISIKDYDLTGEFDKGVLISTGAVGITVQPGEVQGTVTTPIQNGAGSAQLTVVRDRPLKTRLARITPNIATGNTAWVPIVWNSEAEDTAGAWTSGSDIIVPAGQGISRVVVRAKVTFADNAVGTRGIRVLVNGGSPAFSGGDFEAAHQQPSTLYSQTGEIAVSEGQTIRVEVYQSSGGALDVIGAAGSTWVEVEFK